MSNVGSPQRTGWGEAQRWGSSRRDQGVGVGEGQGRNKAGIKLYLLGSFVRLRGLVTRSNEAHKMATLQEGDL